MCGRVASRLGSEAVVTTSGASRFVGDQQVRLTWVRRTGCRDRRLEAGSSSHSRGAMLWPWLLLLLLLVPAEPCGRVASLRSSPSLLRDLSPSFSLRFLNAQVSQGRAGEKRSGVPAAYAALRVPI